MGKIASINISEKKGTVKHPVQSARVIEGFGFADDAHGGDWHRQVSLLDMESIMEMRRRGADVNPGDFAENITTEGLDLTSLAVGEFLKTGTCVLEITQIGKECHGACEIRKKIGDCIMPTRGLFARVHAGGEIRTGDSIEVLPAIRAGVLTLSDKGSRGEREDRSGDTVIGMIKRIGCRTVKYEVLPDDEERIRETLISWCRPEEGIDVIFTTGGTGFSKRDVTPEATAAVLDRVIPGFSEAMRMEGYRHNPRAILSRGVSGIRNGTVVINLPGSVRGVREGLDVVLEVLPHAIHILKGEETECGGSGS